MLDITKRIEDLLAYLGVSPNKFATNCKLGSSNFGKMLRGNMPVTDATIEKIIKTYPQVSLNWLKFGEGEMILEDSPLSEENRLDSLRRIIESQQRTIETLTRLVDKLSNPLP